jgi:hypothetical protein
MERDDTVIMHNEPGTAVALHPGTGLSGVAFLFRSRARIDHRNPDAGTELLSRVYRDVGWRAQELLAAYRAAEDIYFDSVTRIRMSSWSRGRVTLIGDAASCVSPYSAMAPAQRWRAPQRWPHRSAPLRTTSMRLWPLRVGHRAIIRPRQRLVWIASHLLIPRSGVGITLRDQALKIWGGAIGVRLLPL